MKFAVVSIKLEILKLCRTYLGVKGESSHRLIAGATHTVTRIDDVLLVWPAAAAIGWYLSGVASPKRCLTV